MGNAKVNGNSDEISYGTLQLDKDYIGIFREMERKMEIAIGDYRGMITVQGFGKQGLGG